VIDKVLAAMLGVGLIVWLDENERRRELAARGLYAYPGKHPIVLPEAKNDMRMITSYVDKLKRSVYVSETRSPIEIYRLNREFENMKTCLELCKKDRKRMRTHMRNLIDSGERVVNMGNPFVATVLSGVGDLLSELRVGFHTGAQPKELIRKASELCSLLEEQNPEFQLTDEYLEEMLEIS